MGRYMRKSRRIVEVSVMEVTQGVGVRTRARTLALAAGATAPAPETVVGEVSSKKSKTAGEELAGDRTEGGEMQMDYLQLRSRSLVMTRRFSKSERNLDGKRREFADRGRISRCSSISSCEAGEEEDDARFPSANGQKPREDLSSSICYFDCKQERRESTPSCNNRVIYSGELESTAERESRQSAPRLNRMPSASEIEEFFAAAEKSEKQRFASKYNFDFDQEAPLAGQYEWVPIKP
ncbi:hypothetical protein KSP39_PZI016999 [Platanthera zijinensis]|uniref:Cyclin-dependent kinase inhibitor domain-containing protein n=1 Tax=Platanthera zijinensis TaxID=2320716 RepID=A0AAP0B761_9ASPA